MIGFKNKKKQTSGNGGSKAPKWFQVFVKTKIDPLSQRLDNLEKRVTKLESR
ncbi:MAG: hypothetical protein HUJ52_03095 [Malacoplasma sp.]|nr:hypothetical protein [Malacoplasma sp.]